MTYVLSDVHGLIDKFEAMLAEINFGPADRLYIIGDVIDRGEHGVAILRRIMAASNMTLLMGNHELMCLSAVSGNENAADIWFGNGGEVTYKALDALPDSEFSEVMNYMHGLPEYLELDAVGKKFYLVHGDYGDTQYERLWCRPRPFLPSRLPDRRIIVGHTPVVIFQTNPTRYLQSVQHMEIFHCEGFIGVDCGCALVGQFRQACLGCLRLDDMADFYV